MNMPHVLSYVEGDAGGCVQGHSKTSPCQQHGIKTASALTKSVFYHFPIIFLRIRSHRLSTSWWEEPLIIKTTKTAPLQDTQANTDASYRLTPHEPEVHISTYLTARCQGTDSCVLWSIREPSPSHHGPARLPALPSHSRPDGTNRTVAGEGGETMVPFAFEFTKVWSLEDECLCGGGHRGHQVSPSMGYGVWGPNTQQLGGERAVRSSF